MLRAEAGQSKIGGGDAAISFGFRTSSSKTATDKASDNAAALLNGNLFNRSTNSLQSNLLRLGLEQKFNNTISTQTVSARAVTNNFVERYPAAQNLKFSETKSADKLAYTANTGDVYQFPDGKQWRVIDTRDTGNTTGFRAIVLKPVAEKDKHVIVSFAGSGAQIGDWINNVGQAGGNTPSQYRQAVSMAREYQQKYGDNVILTGHSLGGGLASFASLQTGLRATAINSAALSPNNLGGNALFNPSVKNNPRITQYYVPGEVLTNLDNIDLFDARPGNKIAIPGRYNRWIDPRAAIGNHLLGNLAIDVPAPVKVN
ncbi:MAG: DUF2974 domain-containing protein [Acidobacteria bacterium]|jgi:hypothetical protein|nr:DUF2974 domain-containing protein [Acidobacteriota bacterium]